MEHNVKAILFDTRSIQKYIFSGNKLRTNIGASYIVDQVFETDLMATVKAVFPSLDSESWRKGTGKQTIVPLKSDCYVAYIGGGNALLLFKNDISVDLKSIVTTFTKKLLTTYPGLKTGAAIGELDFTTQDAYDASLGKLFKKLKQYQSTVFPVVNVPYTGLTLPCEVNGEAANFYDTEHKIGVESGDSRYYSQEVWAKTKASDKANDHLSDIFKDVLKGKYKFPMELNKLGQKDTEQDIAIVHIDGNQMGVRFSKAKKLAERSALSHQVKEKTINAFRNLLGDIVKEYDLYADYLDLHDGYLPIRPLILGGDDVTFVCAARVAVTYARRFMNYMNTDDGIIKIGPSTIHTCAGIAILPQAYPFFRGYELAEQLCGAAKGESRKVPDSSWLDYAILHGEQAPELAQIRENEYTGAIGKAGGMHFGPYRVDIDDDIRSLQKVLACAKEFATYPQSKIKDMRTVLQLGQHDISQYVQQLHHLGQKLPHIEGWDDFEETLWYQKPGSSDIRTPYVDAIELIDYLPNVKANDTKGEN